MHKRIDLIIILLIMIFSCKTKLNANNNLIEELKSIDKDFQIILWKNKIDPNTNPVGFLYKTSNNEFVTDTGMGFAICEILEMKQISNKEILIKIKGTTCIEFKKSNDAPECNKWEVTILEYKLNSNYIKKLRNSKSNEINLLGKIINQEYKSNL